MSTLTDKQLKRYYHSTFLKEIGVKGQETLFNSKVAVVGVGGLASPILLYLASMGVGHLTLIDDDKVSLSNLPRQILYKEEDISKPKVECAKALLNKINKDVDIKIYNKRLDKSNASSLLKGHDIVLDCVDNFETKFLLSDICKELSLPLVSAVVRDYQGQVCTYIPHISKDFKSLFSILPVNIEQKYIDNDQGIFPFSVGLVGDIAGAEVIKYLLNIGDLLINKLLVVNLLEHRYQIIKFPIE